MSDLLGWEIEIITVITGVDFLIEVMVKLLNLLSVVTHFSAWKVYKFYHCGDELLLKVSERGVLLFLGLIYGTLNIYHSELS